MRMKFSVSGVRSRRTERVGFSASPLSYAYDVSLDGVFPYNQSSIKLVVSEDELELFPIDSVVEVCLEPQSLASETHVYPANTSAASWPH